MDKSLESLSEKCHVCEYDVSASASAVCSECGVTRVTTGHYERRRNRRRMVWQPAAFAAANGLVCGVIGHAVSGVWPDGGSLLPVGLVVILLFITSLFCYLIKPVDRTRFVTELIIGVSIAGTVACILGVAWRLGSGYDFFYPVGPALVAVVVFGVGGPMIQGLCLLVRCCGLPATSDAPPHAQNTRGTAVQTVRTPTASSS
jgi:hypothetical protein